MKAPRWILLVVVIGVAFGFVRLVLTIASASPTGEVSGYVIGRGDPVPGARVRVRATDNYTLTNNHGEFTLKNVDGSNIEVTAWADGYYIAHTFVTPTVEGITLTLRPYHTIDHPDYQWTSPISGTSEGACGNCHLNIRPRWENNAHGGAVTNERFYSLYNGTDLSGTEVIEPGYQLDFMGTAGNCANCHAPGAGVDGYLTTNMNGVRQVITAGIHCDYCHKLGGVYLNPATGSVYPNSPGVQSARVLRPPPGDNIFFGPYDDIHDPDTYLPLISESQYCAPCHQFEFWGTPIYESYEEWLASPYADAGITCQDCHMPPSGDTQFASTEAGGLQHPPESIPAHFQLGTTDTEFMQDTISMSLSTQQLNHQLVVTVSLTNTGAGHHVPTDFPGRHLILEVSAYDDLEQPLSLLDGPKVPSWGGNQAGRPGMGYAKVLRDIKSGKAPVVSYWKQTVLISDNRIPAMGSHSSSYSFNLPTNSGNIDVSTRLIFRRVFQDIADQKGWDIPDINMGEITRTISVLDSKYIYLPILFQNP
jgi:hypothetical protein